VSSLRNRLFLVIAGMALSASFSIGIVYVATETERVDVRADANSFTVTYHDVSRTKSATVAIAMANIPHPGVESSQSAPAFHGDRSSLYQVAVEANPRSERWLVWTESGISALPSPGVPYLLSATGLTDMEFWRLADSLHPNQI